MRKLASIQKIEAIEPIEGADAIEQAITLRALGYSVAKVASIIGVKGNVNSYIRIGEKNGVSPKPLTPEEIEAIYAKHGSPKAPKYVMEL
jgi:hypothetical protein